MTSEELLDEKIRELGDWRGERLTWFRAFVKHHFPELQEEVKWGVGVLTYNGKPLIASSAFTNHVKFNFFHGAALIDSDHIFNSGLDSKQHRSINLAETDTIHETALLNMMRQALSFIKK